MRDYLIGVTVGVWCGPVLWAPLVGGPAERIREWSTKPYCITETAWHVHAPVDREYTRCWKVVEVEPMKKETK